MIASRLLFSLGCANVGAGMGHAVTRALVDLDRLQSYSHSAKGASQATRRDTVVHHPWPS